MYFRIKFTVHSSSFSAIFQTLESFRHIFTPHRSQGITNFTERDVIFHTLMKRRIRFSPLPHHLNIILLNITVNGNQRHGLRLTLRDKQSVERVAVVGG